MAKVVQTSLEEEEYRVFRDLLEKRKLSIREGLRKAVTRMLEEEVRVDPKDPFLVRRPRGRSGLGDLSRKHDEYLYGKKNSRASSYTPARSLRSSTPMTSILRVPRHSGSGSGRALRRSEPSSRPTM